jgi:hypothetical protein
VYVFLRISKIIKRFSSKEKYFLPFNKMANSFDSQQKLEQLITNDTTPSMSTIDILSSLKLINHFEDKIKADDKSASTQIAHEELRYLKLGMESLKSNPSLSNRFGSGFEGAMAITSLLKQRQAERVYEGIINKVLDGDASLNVDVVTKRLNGEGAAIV